MTELLKLTSEADDIGSFQKIEGKIEMEEELTEIVVKSETSEMFQAIPKQLQILINGID